MLCVSVCVCVANTATVLITGKILRAVAELTRPVLLKEDRFDRRLIDIYNDDTGGFALEY